jgi:hypothetical protein
MGTSVTNDSTQKLLKIFKTVGTYWHDHSLESFRGALSEIQPFSELFSKNLRPYSLLNTECRHCLIVIWMVHGAIFLQIKQCVAQLDWGLRLQVVANKIRHLMGIHARSRNTNGPLEWEIEIVWTLSIKPTIFIGENFGEMNLNKESVIEH